MGDYNDDTYNVTVFWEEAEGTRDDVEYVVSLLDIYTSDETLRNITMKTNIDLTLHWGTEYIVTVSSQSCNGTITSDASNQLVLPPIGKMTIHLLCSVNLDFNTTLKLLEAPSTTPSVTVSTNPPGNS